MSKPKQVCMKFYTEVIDADKPLVSTWRYKCNTLIKQKKNKGYTNLLNHILSKHKEEYDQMEKQTEPTLDAFIDKKSKDIYGWLNYVLKTNSPISIVDKECVREFSKYGSIYSKTLRTYMEFLRSRILLEITKELPNMMGIMFDGWSDNGDHYVAIFAIYTIDSAKKQVTTTRY